MRETDKIAVPALEKGAQILQCLAQESAPISLTEICKNTTLPKRSVFSILSTFEQLGFVRKTNNAYSLGIRLYTLRSRALEHEVASQTYKPALTDLRDRTGFTVHFSMYENGMITVLDKLDGLGVVQFKAYKGQCKRLNTSAGGKALAAFLPEEELTHVLNAGFDVFTPTSIATVPAFLAHLEDIRKVGYAIDEGEGEVGVRCIGAPVFTYAGQVFGCVSLTTISPVLPWAKVPSFAQMLLRSAETISRALSYIGPYPLAQCDPTLPHPYIRQIEDTAQ